MSSHISSPVARDAAAFFLSSNLNDLLADNGAARQVFFSVLVSFDSSHLGVAMFTLALDARTVFALTIPSSFVIFHLR